MSEPTPPPHDAVDLEVDVVTPDADAAPPEPIGTEAVVGTEPPVETDPPPQPVDLADTGDGELDIDRVAAELDEIEQTLDRLSG